MGTRTMKKEIFIIKALKTKGYDLEALIQMSDDEINSLPLAAAIIEGIHVYKARGGKTPEQIAEEIATIMMQTDDSDKEVIPEYFHQTPEQEAVMAEIEQEAAVELAEDEVEIIHIVSKPEDVAVVKEALQQKEFRSFASYTKLLKTAVPKDILDAVESTTITELIDARIAEVKAQSEQQ